VEDEHADRVYVPGTNPAPPDRDVEPLWDEDEAEAPVHGRPVPVPPHQAPPPVPVPGPQGNQPVYRPERPVPVPPPPAFPVTQIPAPRPPMAPPATPTPPPTQAWPNLERPAATEPPPAAPTSGERAPEPGPAGPESPWSQPPPARATASVSVPTTIHPEQQPTPPPPAPAPAPAPAQQSPPPEPPNGAIYRPGQQGPAAAPPPGPYPPTMNPQANPPAPPVDPFQDLPWVSDGTPTAEEFARRRLAKPAEPTASMGARAIVNKTAMGLVKLAPGKREQEYKQDVEMVRRNFGGLRQVTVVNPKGGAGKTVAVLLLAMTFGQKRGGYVLAWDNNETQGTLGMRAQQDFHARTVRDMMRDLHLFRGAHGRVGDLSQYVRAQGEGMFDVLSSDESATAGEMLTAGAFAEIREIVSRFYKLIFVDTGNNVRAQNWQAAIDATDQLVITMSARNDSAETAARMLDHLEQSGRQRLVRQAVSVVTMPPTRKDIDLPAIQRHFAARTRAVLMAPYEKLIDSGEPLRYGQLSANTKDAWLKIAAAVAEGL